MWRKKVRVPRNVRPKIETGKTMSSKQSSKGEIVIYQAKDKKIELQVKLERETVWLTQAQIAHLFGTKRPAITKHLHNIFEKKELRQDSVCSILEHTANDGKVY